LKNLWIFVYKPVNLPPFLMSHLVSKRSWAINISLMLCLSGYKEAQTTTSSNFFICRLNPIDFVLFFGLVFATLVHTTLHFLGVAFCMVFVVNKAIYIRKLSKYGGFFMP
jgi:hypothetical protein